MIQRIIMVKLKDEWATPAGRAEVAAHSRAVMGGLKTILGVDVGTPADDAATRSWDLSLVVRLASAADLPGYISEPAHKAYVEDYLSPKAIVKKVWNMKIPGGDG